MDNYRGVIIEESLINKDILKKIKIVSTRVEQVTDEHNTPWILQWTLHTIELPEVHVVTIANGISKSLDSEHSWYADFKNKTHHYIIFRNKVFCVDKTDKGQYNEVKRYGISLGIPEYQLDFVPDDKIWKR